MSTSSIFFWARKRCRMCGKNFFSVYVSHLDWWGKLLDRIGRFSNLFIDGLVFRRSSDFFRKRLSLCFFFFGRYHRNTHQDDLLGNKLIAWRGCLPEGSAKCSSRRIRIAEQENFLCLDYQRRELLFKNWQNSFHSCSSCWCWGCRS